MSMSGKQISVRGVAYSTPATPHPRSPPHCAPGSARGMGGAAVGEGGSLRSQPFVKYKLSCDRQRRMPTVRQVIGFGTVGEDEMSKSAVRQRDRETAPSTENETVVAFPSQSGTKADPPARREWLTE